MDKLKRAIITLLSLFFVPNVYALDLTDAVRPIANLGQFLNGLIDNRASKFLLVFIAMFILFYSIYDVALRLVRVFNGQDKQRKMVAGTLSVLSVLSLYLLAGSPEEFVQRMLAVMGPFGAIVLGIVMFLMVYFAFRDNQHFPSGAIALIAAGLALIVAGSMTGSDSTTSWGFLMLVAGLIWLFIALLGRGGPEGNKDSNKKTPEGKRPGSEDMGPGERKYHKPNRVPEIHLCTVPESIDATKSTARVRVDFNISDEIMASERIDNLSISIRPGKWYNIFAPGVIPESKNIFKKTGPRMFPKEFSMRMFRREYSADKNPYVIPIDIPQGLQISIKARMHNTAGWGPSSSEARIIVGQNICATNPKPKPIPPEPIPPKPNQEEKILIYPPLTFRFEKNSGEREVHLRGKNLNAIKFWYVRKKLIKNMTCNLRVIEDKRNNEEIIFRVDTNKDVLGGNVEEGLYNFYFNKEGYEVKDIVEIIPSRFSDAADAPIEVAADGEMVPPAELTREKVDINKEIEIPQKGLELSKSKSKGALYIKNRKNDDLHWEINTETNPKVEIWIKSTKPGKKSNDFYRGNLKEGEEVFIRPFVKKIKDKELRLNEALKMPIVIKISRNNHSDKGTKIITEIKTHYIFHLWRQLQRTLNDRDQINVLEDLLKFSAEDLSKEFTIRDVEKCIKNLEEMSKISKDYDYNAMINKIKDVIGE